MKKLCRFVILLLLTGFYFTETTHASLVITEIMSQSMHETDTNGDWWELTNTSPSSVYLTGYSWDDSSGVPGTIVFDSITIDAGESIIILDEDPTKIDAWKTCWGLGTEVNVYAKDSFTFSDAFPEFGGSDGIFVYDSSDLQVAHVSYPTQTDGFSNAWDINTTFLGISSEGQYGAWQSSCSSPDVGSPGLAIPEPCSIVLLVLGASLLQKRKS